MKLPWPHGKSFAQGGTGVEERRREGSWCRQHPAALTIGLRGVNASFLLLFCDLGFRLSPRAWACPLSITGFCLPSSQACRLWQGVSPCMNRV